MTRLLAPRVALYARYSSDNQSEASIEDQFQICREHDAVNLRRNAP